MYGLYVHVPFCRQLCPYCDFAVAVRRVPPHTAYCDALLKELSARADEVSGPPHTVYFGGGTPSLWAMDELARFVIAIDLSVAVEVTLEANPLDVTPKAVQAWASMGITRVSIGAQAFDDRALSALGRDHDAARAREATACVVASGLEVSVDLMFGGPDYHPSAAETVAALAPDHVSGYELTIEPGTVFGRRHRAGELTLPDEDALATQSEHLVVALAEAGYRRYEVSSYARDGAIGLHNSGYWLGRPYVGLGMGAHSMRVVLDGVQRRRNSRTLATYLEDPTSPADTEHVDRAAHLGERLFLAARTTLGVPWVELDAPQPVVEAWRRLQAEGLLAEDECILRATPRGLDVADVIAARFWKAATTR